MSSTLACELFSSSCAVCVEQYCSYFVTSLGNFCAKDSDSFFTQKITNEEEYLCSVVDAATTMSPSQPGVPTSRPTPPPSSTTIAPEVPASVEVGSGMPTILLILSLMAALVCGAFLARFSKQIREIFLRYIISNIILGCTRLAIYLAPNATDVPLPYVRFGSPAQTSFQDDAATMTEPPSSFSSTTLQNPSFVAKKEASTSTSPLPNSSKTGPPRPPPTTLQDAPATLKIANSSQIPIGPVTRQKSKAQRTSESML